MQLFIRIFTKATLSLSMYCRNII